MRCDTTLRDSKARVRIRIELVYTTALFSESGSWDEKAVRTAAVRSVTITPVGP
jgi:hypothetical protein